MAQRITANQRVGRPAPKPAKPGKAPIDQFFDAVRNPGSQRTILSRPKAVKLPPVKAPKPPKPTRVQARAAFEKSLAKQNAPTPKQRARLVASGAATFDKKGKAHWVPPPPIADVSANTLSLGGLADRVSRLAVGPNITSAVEGKAFNPYMAPVEALGVLPFGKLFRGAEAGIAAGRAVKAGEGLGEAARVARHGKLPPDRIVNLPGQTVRVPAAPEAHIRAVQKLLDRNVERVIRRGVGKGLHPQEALAQKGLTAKAARARARGLTERVGFYEAKGAEAGPRALANAKLSDAQWVALRQMARRVHPNVTIKANLNRIEEARAAGRTAQVSALKRENTLLQASRHYLEGSGGNVTLRAGGDKATKRLQQVWQDMLREGASSEARQIRMGELNPATAAARKNMPGELDIAKAGYKGYAEHQGGLYYPSARAAKKFSPRGAWGSKADVIPFKPRGETRQPFTGALQETGQESYKVGNLIGKQAASRVNRELAIDRLTQLRAGAMKGTLPQIGELDKAYRAIRLVPTTDSAIAQRYNALIANLDKKVTITPQEAEQVGATLKELRDELMPPVSQVLREGKLPKEYGLVHKAVLGALEDPKLFRTREIGELHRAMMTMSSLAKDMIVYTKIGHMPPRLASNILMALPDTGFDFVRGLTALPRIARQRPDLLSWVHEAMGGGYFKTLTETTSAPHRVAQNVSKGMVGWIEKTADRSPRNAAFLAFAIKDSGHKDIPGLIRYLEGLRDAKPGTEQWAARTRVLLHARQAAGEYERVGRDASLGNWIFLYRWIKASTVWTARFVAKHPAQAAALGYVTSQYGYKVGNPIWNRFNVGGHNVQTALPWSTPPEVGERVARAFTGGFPPLGASPLGMLHPGIPALAAAVGHVDIERGQKVRGNSWATAGKGFLHQTPPGALLAGKGTLHDRLLKFLAGNYAPVSGPAAPPGGTAGTTNLNSGVPGSITPQQRRQLERLLKNEPTLERRLKKQMARMQARQTRR